jgi:hypothetical protein
MIKYVGLDRMTVQTWVVSRHIYYCDMDVIEIRKYGRSFAVSLGLLSACN